MMDDVGEMFRLIKMAFENAERNPNQRIERYRVWWNREQREASAYLVSIWFDALEKAAKDKRTLPLPDCNRFELQEVIEQAIDQAEGKAKDPWIVGKVAERVRFKGRF